MDALAGVLAEPAGDPFAPEIVAVPERGVERWLAQRLSHRLGSVTGSDGVCANVEFPPPSALLERAVTAVTGVDPSSDAWSPTRSVWPLLQVLDEAVASGDARFAGPAAHLEGGGEGRRYGLARKLAGLFAAYATHRPGLLLGWLAGDPSATPPDLEWQAELWRRLHARIGEPGPGRAPGAGRRGAARRRAGARAAGAAVAVRPHPPGRRAPVGDRRAGRSPGRAPVAAAPLAGHVGRGAGGPVGAPAVAVGGPQRRPGAQSAAALARAGRAGAGAAAALRAARTHTIRARVASRGRCWPGCSPRSPPTRLPRSRTSARCSTTPTGASPCTPATDRTGRSRCCARSCSGCWRRTRPWSRGT